MSDVNNEFAELQELCWAQQVGELSPEAAPRLEELVLRGLDLCDYYISYIGLFAAIEWSATPHGPLPPNEHSAGVVTLVIPKAPLPASHSFYDFFGETTQNAFAYWTQGWPLAYLVATVLFAASLLIGSRVPLSRPVDVAQAPPSPTAPVNRTPGSSQTSSAGPVGKISGLADCQWSSDDAVAGQETVCAGRRLRVEFGLLEITYNTGAKVILQGPAVFETDANGGFLAMGRLTGKLEKTTVTSQPLSPIPGSFTIRTPTAVVTDLGTEFGVEVDQQGHTTSQVFRGSVQVRLAAEEESKSVVVKENEAVRVESDAGQTPSIRRIDAEPRRFARQLAGRRIPIQVFNTGVGVEIEQPDPHWQVTAVSTEPEFQPRPAVVPTTCTWWASSNPQKSQWISLTRRWSLLVPANATYTFRTTFELKENVMPETAVMVGWFLVDDKITGIRLNGRDMRVPEFDIPKSVKQTAPRLELFRKFTVNHGFIAGNNVLDIDVENIDVTGKNSTRSTMGLRVELEGSVREKAGR